MIDTTADPQFQARQMVHHLSTGCGLALAVPGVVPQLSAQLGAIRSAAPTLDRHTAQLRDALRDRLAGEPGVWLPAA